MQNNNEDKDMKYKIIALDVDGTLVNSKLQLTDEVREALISVQRDYGMRVIIASGRPTAGLRHLAEQLELARYSGYVLPFNGGQMYNARAMNEPFARMSLPDEVIPQLYAMSQEFGLNILTYSDTEILTERLDDPNVQKEMGLTVMPSRQIENFVRDVPRNLPKCLIVGEPKAIEALVPIARERFKGVVDAFTSDPCFLELVPAGVNKGLALQKLLERLDYDRSELIAVGDSFNDLEMIQFAGLGVAMGNAREAIKSCADYVTKSNDEDGVAHLLRKHVFNAREKAPYTVEEVNAIFPGTLMGTLGIECTEIAKGYVEGRMPVDHRTGQPLGIIHGGANLAFAETLAGLGSVALLEEGEMQVGAQVSGNHVASAMTGDTMVGKATIMHQGRSTHVWSVEIYSLRSGKLIHTARVLNSIMKKR